MLLGHGVCEDYLAILVKLIGWSLLPMNYLGIHALTLFMQIWYGSRGCEDCLHGLRRARLILLQYYPLIADSLNNP